MESFRQAMRQLGVTGKIIATDTTPASPAFHKADVGVQVPSVRRVEYLPALMEAVKTHEVRLLVPLTDLDLRSLARHREDFAKIGCTVMVGSEPIVRLCRDKALTNRLFEKVGLATIKSFTLNAFMKRPFFPCFVKPASGSAGIGATVIKNNRELKLHISAYGPRMVVQEIAHGQEYTIDVYRSRDGQVRCVVPRQRLAVRSGEVEKGLTVKDQPLMDSAIRIAEAMDGMWGVFCCQCRRSNNSPPKFFDINPRFGGGAPLSIAAGADLPLYLLQEVLGEKITAKLGDFTDRLLMMRYDAEVFVNFQDDPRTLPGYKTPVFR